MRRVLPLLLLSVLLPDAVGASDAVAAFRSWMRRYQQGRVDLYEAVPVPIPAADDPEDRRFYRSAGVDELDALLAALVAQGDTDAARVLLEAASLTLERTAAEEREKHVTEQPWLVRRRAAQALWQIADPEVAAWLRSTPIRDNATIGGARRRGIAALALAHGRQPGALQAIQPLLHDEAGEVRVSAAMALGVLGDADAIPALGEVRADAAQPPPVRLEALLAIDAIAASPDALDGVVQQRMEAAWAALEDNGSAVRFAAARILRDHPSVDSIPILVAALQREQESVAGSRRRVRVALRDALARITGEDFPSYRPADWADWWDGVRGDFALADDIAGRAVVPEQGARFFGIPVEGDTVVFLLDASGSMDRPASGSEGGASRLFLATRELRRCVDALDPKTHFNVVLFNERVTPFAATPLAAEEPGRTRLAAFLTGLDADGGTDLIGALMFALGDGGSLAQRLLGDEIDTLIVLTDGAPSRGPVLIPEEILHQVDQANRGRHITIHTVCVTARPSAFLDQLAARNRGQSTHLRP